MLYFKLNTMLNENIFSGCTEEYQINNASTSDKGASVPLMHLVRILYFKKIWSFEPDK